MAGVLAKGQEVAEWLGALRQGESGRAVLWLPVCFAGGIALYFALDQEPGRLWPAFFGVLLLALAVWAGLRGHVLRAYLALLFAMLLLGFLTAGLRTDLVSAPVLERELGPLMVTGTILESEPRATGRRLLLQIEALEDIAPEDTPARARLQVSSGAESLLANQRIEVLAILRPPPGPVAPGAYDFARDAFFQGIGAVGYAVAVPQVLAAGESRAGVRFYAFWAGLRQVVEGRIAERLTGDEAGIAIALMTGEKGAISPAAAEAMRRSGLAHLLAISGLHLGLVAGLVFLVLRYGFAAIPRLALDYPVKKWAALAALPAAGGYLLLVGAPVPTERAFITASFVLLAVLLDRQPISMRLVAAAAFLVLLISPENLVTPSFQMSFAAVIALVAFYESLGLKVLRVTADLGLAGRVLSYLLAVMATSLIASLATAPFAIFHFNRIVWLGLAANMIAVPVTALWIMPWALIAYLLMPFGLEGVPLDMMAFGISLVLGAAEGVAGLELAASLVPEVPLWGLILTALAGLWLALWQRPWRFAAVPFFALGLVSFLFVTPPDLLIEDEGRLVALYDGETLLLSSTRRARFEAEIWAHRFAVEEEVAWGDTVEGARWQVACDDLACLARADGRAISIVRHPAALGEDCAVVDVVFNLTRHNHVCDSASALVSLYDLQEKGPHALWLSPLSIISAAELRGHRPWVQPWDDQ